MRAGIAVRLFLAASLMGCALACGGGADEANEGTGVDPTVVPPPSVPSGAAGSGGPTAGGPSTAVPPMQQPPAQVPPAQVPPAQQPAGQQPPAQVPPAQQPAGQQPPTAGGTPTLAMDECGLKTKYPGDQFCILPPPADKGFQMHIGPADYDNPDPRYVLQPGGEVTENFTETSGNDQEVYYYWRQYRMRPGSHHLIITTTSGAGAGAPGGFGGIGGGRRIGGSSNAAKDNPEAGVIAPENEGVGMPLAAHSTLNNSLHYFNVTDKPVIKEVWVNFWYRDKAAVTQPTAEVFSMLGMGIAPGTRVVKHGACRIAQPGRLLTVYGHVHAHNKRFSVWRTRGSDKTLLHEQYDWEHPNVSEFSSTVMNPPTSPGKDGGFSGPVDLMAGDTIEFECDILNDTDGVFLGANEANNDEMCIMIGDTVGTTIPGACTSSDLPGPVGQ